jgi:hypothetical protein
MNDPCGEMIIKTLLADTKRMSMLSGGVAMIYAGLSTNDVQEKLNELDVLADIVKVHIQTLKGYL